MVRLAVIAAVLAASLAVAPPAAAAKDAAGRTVHIVYPGQTLGKIAKRYNVSVEDLCRANELRRGAPIRPAQKLIIPDGSEAAPSPARGGKVERWQDYAKPARRKGYLVLEAPTKRWRGYVLTKRGSVLPKARESIERMFSSWRTGKRHPIDPRLIQLVVRVSDAFGGRPIRVVSGYRERSYALDSKHKVGAAFDFSIPGVPNALVRDYLRTLPRVGVGYYPRSTHVHLDVRDRKTYWIDHSGPGEAPRRTPEGAAHAEAAAESEVEPENAPADTVAPEPEPAGAGDQS